MKKQKPTHGGAREGAGRPTDDPKTKTIRVTETEHKLVKGYRTSDHKSEILKLAGVTTPKRKTK